MVLNDARPPLTKVMSLFKLNLLHEQLNVINH